MDEVSPGDLEGMKRTIERLEARVEELERGRGAGEVPRRVDELLLQGGEAPGEPRGDIGLLIPRRAAIAEAEGRSVYLSGLYTKPFLYGGSSLHIGGYLDLAYGDVERRAGTFDLERFVPFVYADVTDRVKLAAEVEIESGEELGIEFGVIDYEWTEPLSFRAGIILSPIGRYNLVHDSPIRDLTSRPLVTRTVVPAVSREAGAGFFGSLVPEGAASDWNLSYELYLSTGFNGLDRRGNNVITQQSGLRDARASKGTGGSEPFRDNNGSVATMGRIAVSPHPGIEAGFSLHTGSYDERADNRLTLLDIDLTLTGSGTADLLGSEGFLADRLLRPSELLVEWARADIERDDFARAAGVIGDLDGFYLQWNYHFGEGLLETMAQRGLVGEGAHFTASARYGESDLDGARRRRTTLGLNFRPNPSKTVFKLEYQLNGESGDLQDEDNDAFWFSVATYF